MSKRHSPVYLIGLNRIKLLGFAFLCSAFLSVTVLFLASCQDSADTAVKTEETNKPRGPVGTKEPGESEDPDETKEPGESEDPDETKEPGKPSDPNETKEPGKPSDPNETKEPGKPKDPTEISQTWVDITGVEALKTYLTGKPENTELTPYRIKLSGVDLSSTVSKGNTLRTLYDALVRYAALDLSKCTGESLSNISSNTAPNKAHIVSLILPETVTVIKTNTFSGCAAMISVEMPKVTSIMHGAFSNLSKLESVSMPEVQVIKTSTLNTAGVFYKCSALTTVSLPKIESIGNNAFYNSGLVSLTLGAVPPVLEGTDVFKNAKGFTTIYVPTNAVETYMNTDWDTLQDKITSL